MSHFEHDFSKLNAEDLLNNFVNVDLSYLMDNVIDDNSKFKKFIRSLPNLDKYHAALKRLPKRYMKFRNKPFVNSKIQNMIHIRDRVFNKYKKSNDASLKDLYIKFRNCVSKSLKESKASYFCCYFQRNSNNMKQLWPGIKSVIVTRKSSNTNVVSKNKDSNGNTTSDPAAIVNMCNKYFINVSRSITSTIQRSFRSLADFMSSRVKSFFFITTSAPCELADINSLLKP